MGVYMVINCDYCGKEFNKSQSQINKYKHHFCCNECRLNYNKKNKFTKAICDYCKTEFEIETRHYKKYLKGINKHIFCSKECNSKFYGEIKSNTTHLNKVCEFCGKEYHVPNYKLNTSKFCSLECYENFRKNKVITLNCDFCNKEFTNIKSQVDKYQNHFCSKECKANYESIVRKEENKEWGYSKIECVCETCKTIIYRTPYEINRCKNNVFCSIECKDLWMKNIFPYTEEGKEHYKNNGITTVLNNKYNNTVPELLVKQYLINNNISYEFQLLMYNKFIVDFYIPDKNIVIEVQGDYWHGNPLKYGDGKIPLNERQIKQINKDKSRYAYLTKCGHSVYMIWEADIHKDIEKCLSFLN
jgi:very-short-patch-repair endonuclease